MFFADHALARRLEAADALNAAESGRAQARIHPESGATVLPIAGGYACFAGATSPLTHAIGVGMVGPVTEAQLDELEEFYRSRGAAANIDLCPLADPSLMEVLGRRGYRPVEFNNVLVRPVEGGAGSIAEHVKIAKPEQAELWARTMVQGFFEREDLAPEEVAIGMTLFEMPGASGWFASVDQQPAAAAAMCIRNGLATFFGDSALVGFRRRGLHRALIRARLAYARELDCDLAVAATLPGSYSQLNYERCGFQVVYTKVNMQRELR